MSNHQKRLSAPTSWPVERKTETFTVKVDAGPHGEAGVPLLILLRDVLGYVDSRKEARYALEQDTILVNGTAVSDVSRPIGMFDIVVFEERDEHYRVFPDEGGRLALMRIDAEDAGSKLGKIVEKRQVAGGRTQLTAHDGQTIVVDDETAYAPGDSLVLDTSDGSIVAHFPYEEGSLVTAVDGRHAGEIGTITDIDETPGSSSNAVGVETNDGLVETIEEYVVVIDENFVEDSEEPDEAATESTSDVAESDDVEAESEAEDSEAIPDTIEDIAGVGPSKAESLRDAGFESVADIRDASPEDLSEVSGIGEALVERIKADIEGGADE